METDKESSFLPKCFSSLTHISPVLGLKVSLFKVKSIFFKFYNILDYQWQLENKDKTEFGWIDSSLLELPVIVPHASGVRELLALAGFFVVVPACEVAVTWALGLGLFTDAEFIIG